MYAQVLRLIALMYGNCGTGSVYLITKYLHLELIGFGDYPADQHNGKTFLFIEDVCGLAFDARRELINN